MTREERHRLLAALSDTLLPADGGPGTAEAGVADYLERALDRRSERSRARIESGLVLVESMARQGCGKPFEECGGGERADILKQLERVPHPMVRGFLSTLVSLTLEGFLCHPSHGGNQDEAGWRAIGHAPDPRR